MAVTKSNKSNITSPNGNSLALFVDINDDKLKMKDINGEVQSLDDFVSVSGGTLQIEGGALINGTLQNVTDAENNVSQLQLATNATKINGNLEVASDLDVGGNTNIDGNTLILGTLEVDNTTKIKTDNVTYLDVEDGSGNNRFTISRPSLGQKVAIDYASNPLSSLEIVGSIRTFQNGTILSDVVTFRRDGQVTFSERVNVEADSLVTTQTSSVIASTTTNANLVIAPNGTGALVADIPDGTATGGNARGTNAVDLQTNRLVATSVASGTNSTISGGRNNSASGADSTISGGVGNIAIAPFSISAGGNTNTASGNFSTVSGGNVNNATSFQSTVGGGGSNTASGQNSVVGGGELNTASSNHSTISGGQSNTASTNTHATVVGGQSNTSNGQGSISGGRNCVASAGSAISFGFSNNVSGFDSGAFGAVNNVSTATSYAFGSAHTIGGVRSNGFGYGSLTYLRGQFSVCTGGFNGGDAQHSALVSWREAILTTGATTTLSLDGTGTTNLIIPTGNNRMWKVKVEFIGTITLITGTATGLAVGNSVYGESNFGFKRVGGTSSMGAFIDDAQASDNAIMDTCALVETAGASQELALTFTGPTFAGGGSVTMRVVAKVSLVEVAY
jgi:hypothetical protein